jgi:sulfite exporter TauE/SafE
MPELFIPLATALWLGILTSISPCPLATNIAAISYVGRRVDRPSSVFYSGVLYTAGRMLTYLVLGIVLVSSMLSAPMTAFYLQKYMNMVLGPVLIIVGLILLDIISFSIGGGISEALQKKADSLGIWGAGFLGILFALSFCPTSAALFFGSLLPIALKHQSGIILPGIYGIATGLPVIIFAVLIGLGANRVAKAYDKIVIFEKWARKITAVIFIAVGIYYSLVNIFGVTF